MRSGFTLVELLTVIFIISLLIGILVPTIRGARNAAKKATTAKTIDTVKVALEMFKNDNEAEFRQTNGYPPSFAHPPIGSLLTPNKAAEGRFPFVEGLPVVYGAHWLPAMLMGVDAKGFIARSSIPDDASGLRNDSPRWYTPAPLTNGKALPRQQLYLDPKTKTLPTEKLPGRQPSANFFQPPDWGGTGGSGNGTGTVQLGVKDLPVIVDAFDQPILYYVANAFGKETNMVAAKRSTSGYAGGDQEDGVPYYVHQDNEGFTGSKDGGTLKPGWDFGAGTQGHAIADSGTAVLPSEIASPVNRETFARYIVDRKLYARFGAGTRDTTMRPCNKDTFLLISAGPDGRYGTSDDVSNLPPFEEE